jgi:hypothetical protein
MAVPPHPENAKTPIKINKLSAADVRFMDTTPFFSVRNLVRFLPRRRRATTVPLIQAGLWRPREFVRHFKVG